MTNTKQEVALGPFPYVAVLLLTLGGVGFLWIFQYLGKEALQAPFVQIGPTIIGLFMGGLGVMSWWELLTLKRYEIRDGQFFVKSIFGPVSRVIQLSDLVEWRQEKHKGKYSTTRKLFIYTRNGKLTIDSQTTRNYDDIKRAVKSSCPKQPLKMDTPVRKRRVVGVLAIVSLLFGLWSFTVYQSYDLEEESKVVLMEVKLTSNPEKVRSGRHNQNESIEFSTREYPTFTFSVSGGSYDRTAVDDVLGDFKAGDSIRLFIKKDIYAKKILGTESLDFWDKHLNYSMISVYGIEGKGYVYLEAESNLAAAGRGGGWIVLALIAGVLTFITISVFLEKATP
ncbi:MAG: hypothetical protein JJ975_08175 [Bacteroidia bacterium]|nr:hypothetical protein [Bacteroidia bacterium]